MNAPALDTLIDQSCGPGFQQLFHTHTTIKVYNGGQCTQYEICAI